MKTALVTGGAGYIGSHTVRELLKEDYNIIILDDLNKGHKESVPENVKLIIGDLNDTKLLDKIFSEENIDFVIHFAASIEAGESMTNPQKFFKNNTRNTMNLLESMLKHNVKKIVFSSTAAVYGEPEYIPIDEKHPKKPTNYYGLSKLMIEQILEAYDHAYGLKFIALRYFNASGADMAGKIGQDYTPDSHLIPIIIKAALGQRDCIKVFGTDYKTEDGTCIRDYIHVSDHARAHVLAIKSLYEKNQSDKINLGTRKGYSVKEVIDMVKEVSGKDFKIIEESRREGDPANLIAEFKKAELILGWAPQHGLRDIISSAWTWHSSHPDGY